MRNICIVNLSQLTVSFLSWDAFCGLEKFFTKYQLKAYELEENVAFCLGFCECCGSEGADGVPFSRFL